MGVEHKEVPVLRLQDVSPRRVRAFSLSFKCEKGDPLGTGATPPFLSAPSSPKFLRMLEDGDSAVTENLLPSCRLEGAVPFKWEEKPGTPKSPQVTALRPWSSSPEFEQDRVAVDSPRSASKELFCSSVGSLSPLPEFAEARDQAVEEEPQADFEFSSSRFEVSGGGGRAGGEAIPHPAVAADELFFQGHLLPLKPPPRLQSQLTASKHWRSATCESLPVTEGGDGSDSSPQSPSGAPPRSLGQAVGLTTVSGRGGARSGSASAAKKLLSFCGLSNKGVRRSLAVGRDEARLSTSDVYLMSGQESGGSTEARLSSAKDSSGELYGSFSSHGEERRRDRSRGRSTDFTGRSRGEESNFASADCSLPAGSGTKASLPATPIHRKGKSNCQKDKSGGFLSGFRSGKEEDGSRQAKKLFKEEEGAVDAGDSGAAHRRVRSLSPLSVFRRAERTKRGVSVDEKDGNGISFDSQISWPFDEKERDTIDSRPNAGVPKKLLGNSSKAWSGLRGLTLTELLEDPRDVVASSRHTDSPGSNSSSGSFGAGSGSFGSMTSSNSGGSNSSGAAESVDAGPLPYYPQDVKPGRHSNASASPGLKKALLTKSQGSPPDSTCTSDALGSDHFPLYRRYKSQPGKEDPLGRFKSLLPIKGGIFSCLGCSTVKSYDAFQGVPNMRVA